MPISVVTGGIPYAIAEVAIKTRIPIAIVKYVWFDWVRSVYDISFQEWSWSRQKFDFVNKVRRTLFCRALCVNTNFIKAHIGLEIHIC